MSRVKNPQDKKRLAYELDHRNASGESVKAWRRNKPLKKAKAIRAFRKSTNDLLQATLSEEDAAQTATKKAGSIAQEKIIDWGPVKLGAYVKLRLSHRKASIGAKNRRRKKTQNAA